ncbi:MAG: hypothetical protein IPJ69_08485 [Deltaproteobacteria bacterium]|nr:MAG: hypothetical protein IPJ69_08485 [Deltaproteobacteria bacterium]
MSTFLNQLGSQIAILRQDLSCQKPSQTSALPEVNLSKFYDLDKGIKDYLGEEADLPLDNLTLLKNLRRNGNVFASESLFQKNLQAAVENGFLMLSVEELKKHIHVSGEEPSSEQEQAFVALKVRRFLELTSEKRMAHHLRLSQNPSDLPTLSNRITDLENKISGSTGIYGFDDKYTGAGIGDGGTFSLFNTLASARQVVFALAFSSHPLVIMVIEDEGINPSNFCGEDFVANQILDGLKVLELGCGQIPTHARILRAMGAQVFTVDLQPESTFKKLPHDPKYVVKKENIIFSFISIEKRPFL